MSFRPASFTDIRRSGPPTTRNGTDWVIPISLQPPTEWLQFFETEGGPGSLVIEWALNVRSVELQFRSSPDDVPHTVQVLDRRIALANEQYRHWLQEAHRRGADRRRGEQTEAERIQGLNRRFKDL
jgi:hypothetical protein